MMQNNVTVTVMDTIEEYYADLRIYDNHVGRGVWYEYYDHAGVFFIKMHYGCKVRQLNGRKFYIVYHMRSKKRVGVITKIQTHSRLNIISVVKSYT